MRAELVHDGGAGRALVYVPGIDGTGELLFDLAPRLESRFRLLCVGYVPGGEDTYVELAGSLMALLETHGVRDALLLAESFGTGVALEAALDRPEPVRALALVNGFAHFPARLRLAASRASLAAMPEPLFALGRRFAAPRALLGPRAEPELSRRLVAAAGGAFGERYRARMRMIATLDLRPRLGELHRPVALFVSDHDRVVPPRASRELARLLPDARLEELTRAGHVVLPVPAFPWLDWLEALWDRSERGDRQAAARPAASPSA